MKSLNSKILLLILLILTFYGIFIQFKTNNTVNAQTDSCAEAEDIIAELIFDFLSPENLEESGIEIGYDPAFFCDVEGAKFLICTEYQDNYCVPVGALGNTSISPGSTPSWINLAELGPEDYALCDAWVNSNLSSPDERLSSMSGFVSNIFISNTGSQIYEPNSDFLNFLDSLLSMDSRNEFGEYIEAYKPNASMNDVCAEYAFLCDLSSDQFITAATESMFFCRADDPDSTSFIRHYLSSKGEEEDEEEEEEDQDDLEVRTIEFKIISVTKETDDTVFDIEVSALNRKAGNTVTASLSAEIQSGGITKSDVSIAPEALTWSDDSPSSTKSVKITLAKKMNNDGVLKLKLTKDSGESVLNSLKSEMLIRFKNPDSVALPGRKDIEDLCKDETGVMDAGCVTCYERGGIWIAIGCVDPTPLGIMTRLIQTAIGVMGGVALIQLIMAGIAYQRGKEEDIQKYKQKVIATLTGLVVLVFSVLILRIIGVNVLDIVPSNFL